ncbi:MAG: hypothetical protein AB1522_03740 [Chloroflexota bacterium]
MQRWLIGLFFLLFLSPSLALAQAGLGVEILNPAPDQVLQGVIEIQAQISPDDVLSYELLFGYAGASEEGSLFLLAQGEEINPPTPLYLWDTTLIPDGDYRLVLRVRSSGGETEEDVVEPLRVRNYTAVDTPAPAENNAATAVITETPTPISTPTPLQSTPLSVRPNPGSIQPSWWLGSVLRGISGIILLFLLLGIYVTLRKNRKRR